MNSVLILGASGYLGRNLLKDLSAKFTVFGSSRSPDFLASRAIELPNSQWIELTEWQKHILALKPAARPLAVINTVAMINHAQCEENATEAKKINVDFALDAAKFCKKMQIAFYQISTDGLFFETETPPPQYWKPTREVHARNVYAQTKREAEKALEQLQWGHIMRCSFVGPDQGTKKGLLYYLATCAAVGTGNGYIDNFFTPLHTKQLAERLTQPILENRSGFSLEHLSSYPALNKAEYLKKVAEKAGITIVFENRTRGAQTGSLAIPLDQSLWSENPVSTEELLSLSADDLLSMIPDV